MPSQIFQVLHIMIIVCKFRENFLNLQIFFAQNDAKAQFYAIFLKNIWWFRKKIVPLQPISEKHRGVEQLVARQAHNLEVACSSPASATKKNASAFFFLLRQGSTCSRSQFFDQGQSFRNASARCKSSGVSMPIVSTSVMPTRIR